MTFIEQAKTWLKGDGVPQPIPGLMTPIDADHLSDELRLVVRGQDTGAANQPSSTETTYDAVEEDVIGTVLAEYSLQREHLITMLKAYRDRLAELNAVAEMAKLRNVAHVAVVKFRQHKQEGRGDLARLRDAYLEARDELHAFRVKHGLSRPARDPSGRWTTIGLLVVVVALESAMNGLFFAKGSTRGLVGGVGTAFGISLVNVLFCFLLGLVPARFVNYRVWPIRTVATLVTVAGLAAIFFVHLFAAHLRDATASIGESRAYALAALDVFTHPWKLADISSWYLLGLGLLFGLISFWKGYRHDDPYPFYGDVFRRERDAAERYNEVHQDFFGDLEDVRDEAVARFDEGITNIPEYVAKGHQVRAARSALIERFLAYEQMIEQTINRLLAVYRDANRRRRTTDVPQHFSSKWRLAASGTTGPDIIALTTDPPDSFLANVELALAELRELSSQVLGTYDELLSAIEHPSDMKR